MLTRFLSPTLLLRRFFLVPDESFSLDDVAMVFCFFFPRQKRRFEYQNPMVADSIHSRPTINSIGWLVAKKALFNTAGVDDTDSDLFLSTMGV